MNSLPPSKDFLCVGNGPSDRALHPDRAPYTQLAEQDGVILFSGAAPQQGLNFTLSAGSLVYRNQMSTLGSSEPPPQIGTAGTLLQRPWDFVLPWSEARWSPGENIVWRGFRQYSGWLEGIPEFQYERVDDCPDNQGGYDAIANDSVETGPVYRPCMNYLGDESPTMFRNTSSLELVRGIYQMGTVRRGFLPERSLDGVMVPEPFDPPYLLREPWFQGRGRKPAFNVDLPIADTNLAPEIDFWSGITGDPPSLRIAKDYYPNFLNIYPYRQLELEGGRLTIDFERSATWPRTEGQEASGAVVAESIRDQFGNMVYFDRVPKYGWETDFKVPSKPYTVQTSDSHFGSGFPFPDREHQPKSNAWQLPHKRLRTVRLIPKEDVGLASDTNPHGRAAWTIAFVYEHPESDRIGAHDTPDYKEWKSLYSYLPQEEWDSGRLSELNDETTLLTVQVYQGDKYINGAPFQDDHSVWASRIPTPGNPLSASDHARVNKGLEFEGEFNGDSLPGIAGVDDDGDGKIDEDCKGRQSGDDGYGGSDCLPLGEDDNEDCDQAWKRCYVENSPACPDQHVGNQCGDNPTLICIFTVLGCITPTPGSEAIRDGSKQYSDGPGRGQAEPLTTSDGLPSRTGDNQLTAASHYDPFYVYDDDADGIYDEDGLDDPLLVNLRAITGECAKGIYPYVPRSDAEWGGIANAHPPATMPGMTWNEDCRPPHDAADDPWVHQVQYVYARSNPYWLLSARNVQTNPSEPCFGRVRYLQQPQYYYFPPFSPDLNQNGTVAATDTLHTPPSDVPSCGDIPVTEPQLVVATGGDFDGLVIHAADQDIEQDEENLPNVHPDCVPDPDYRGPQGYSCGGCTSRGCNPFDAVKPGDIHLIKRIVRTRPDASRRNEFIEKVWLYRYNDFGFLKAVFDPASVQAILDLKDDDAFDDPDDILQYADTYPIDGKPLILYASQWYTYYNPLPIGGYNQLGIPPCYEELPFVGEYQGDNDLDELGQSGPFSRLPMNACDGQTLWQQDLSAYSKEMHADPPCSDFMRKDCGVCAYGKACSESPLSNDAICTCAGSPAKDDDELAQMGIPGAQPRFRKHLIKTARVRGADGQMHAYRFDYLGAASGVYGQAGHITSYADAHNITVVDELVEQTACEFGGAGQEGCPDTDQRNEFYIYENDFHFVLDASAARETQTEGSYGGAGSFIATSHYLYVPVKVKTRRVVTMNYYGIAMSDRLILTPGFNGTQTQLVNDQQYELVNKRGQVVHLYDPSWVAALRVEGAGAIKEKGRVLVELFGGEKGLFSVLRGIAWGSGGGNLYNQQCKNGGEILNDVPVQRVTGDALKVVSATQHLARLIGGKSIVDLPSKEVSYSTERAYSDPAFDIDDQAMTIGGTSGDDGCESEQVEVHLENQDPVTVSSLPGNATQDGASVILYAYDFHDETDQSAVKWKWRWQEAVPVDQGGTADVALEAWYFDENGQIRLYGRGAGEPQGEGRPNTKAPFYITYFGYDELGRLALQIDDIDPNDPPPGLAGDPILTDARNTISRKPINETNDTAANLITKSVFDFSGALKSRIQGQAATAAPDNSGENWASAVRTDYMTVGNRSITYLEGTHRQEAWSDPHIYQFEFQHVKTTTTSGSSVEAVHGTTSVRILDKAGRPIEERLIGWNPARSASQMTDKVEPDKHLWAIRLTDYESNHAIDGWGVANIPDKLWTNATDPDGDDDGKPELVADINPQYPGVREDESGFGVWPPSEEDRIVTLARSFKLYKQASSLKPTHEIVFRSFDSGNDDDVLNSSRAVVREYKYDLEDRIARQEEPDGTVTRLLFDPKRRPTKVFKGSQDGSLDWFPPGDADGCSSDDMVLTDHYLYNDGFKDREFNPLPAAGSAESANPCQHPYAAFTGSNDNFPNNAAKLVRTRRFTGDAEPCDCVYKDSTSSRDVRYVYDWRGRPVIQLEEAIGYPKTGGASSLDNPKFISATTTVYDNLSQPLLVATWSADAVPTVADVQAWAEEMDADAATVAILNRHPVALSRTLYDDRGRPYEQRRYNVDDTTAPLTYEFTKTFRDDLDRVVAELGPTGLTTNKYDSLGRILVTSWWSKDVTDGAGNHLGTPDSATGVELTRTSTTYDPFGNVLTQTHYDRKNTSEPGPITNADNPGSCNAIITYSYNWYDDAKRLSVTANYGTYGADGFTNASGPPPYAMPTWNGTSCEVEGVDEAHKPLITRFGYDQAGRRIWTQDPKGVVTRTWYDLLGHVLLVAENWKDEDEHLSPDQPGQTLTPSHEGPIRYTAYHYTRGGLQDAIVAIPAGYAQLTPTDFAWNDGIAPDYGVGEVVSVQEGGLSFQLTKLKYGDNVVAENLVVNPNITDPISRFPDRVSRVEYPDESSLELRYTIDGKLARRTDSRDVTLSYGYGTQYSDDGQSLSSVTASIPAGSQVDSQVKSLTFNHQHGFLRSASSILSNGGEFNLTEFLYDGYQNLTQEWSQPLGSTADRRSTQYVWSNAGNGSRPEQIVYPSGMRVRYDYGPTAGADAEDAIKRMTGLTEVNASNVPVGNIARYEFTGGGKKKRLIWGENSDQSNAIATLNLLPDSPNQIAVDRFGRLVNLAFHVRGSAEPSYQFQYGYDTIGNVLWNRITQPGSNNLRSFLYQYDALNRLKLAQRGPLDTSNTEFTSASSGWKWTMDVLGNWVGDGEIPGLETFESNGGQVTSSVKASHVLSEGNRLTYINHEDLTALQRTAYDAGGNLTKDDLENTGGDYAPLDHEYKYDAWNRLVQVKRRHAPTGTEPIVTPVVTQLSYDALGRRVVKKVTNSTTLDTGGQGDLFYYDGNRIIEQYAFVPSSGGGGGGGGGGGNCQDVNCGGGDGGAMKARVADASLGIRGQLLAEAQVRQRMEEARAHGDTTPAGLLRLMRPRSQEEGNEAARQQGNENNAAEPSAVVPAKSVATSAHASLSEARPSGSVVAQPPPLPRGDQGGLNPQIVELPATNVYELNKAHPDAQIGDDPKDAVRMSETPGTYQRFRTFVYGLDYLNERVLMADQTSVYYLLQDANYNVRAYLDSAGGGDIECEYEPYGRMVIRHSSDPPGTWTDHEYNPENPTSFFDLPGFQGGTQDRETGLICFGHRCYDPDLGRWLQVDPNGTGLALTSATRYQGQPPSVSAAVAAVNQFDDGMNIYVSFGGNPITGRDPSGLSLLDDDWNHTLANWDEYAKSYPGRAWQRRFDSLQSADDVFGAASTTYDEDVLSALQDLEANRADALGTLEQASHKIRYGHKLSQLYAGASHEWDDLAWEQSENALYSMLLGPFGSTICFVAGTEVVLADGSLKNIEDIRIGDKVLTQIAIDAPSDTGYVLDIFANEAYELIELSVGETLIRCTPEHPFWVRGRGWSAAKDLQIDDPLATSEGTAPLSKSSTLTVGAMPVYNLEISGSHAYYVSPSRVLVHNSCRNWWSRAQSFLKDLGLNGVVKVHHIIPRSLGKHFGTFFKRVGFEVNHALNLKFLRTANHPQGLAARHRAYIDEVFNEVSSIERSFNSGAITPQQAFQQLKGLQRGLHQQLRTGGRWQHLGAVPE